MPSHSIQLDRQLTESARENRERELLERIDARDREAMRKFYLLYYHRLARFLSRMTRRHELIDEMINDTLVVVWEKAGDFRGHSLVSTWIMGIAYRRGLSLLRSESRAQERMVLPMSGEEDLRDRAAEQCDIAELLERALESLPPDQRAVLELLFNVLGTCARGRGTYDASELSIMVRFLSACPD